MQSSGSNAIAPTVAAVVAVTKGCHVLDYCARCFWRGIVLTLGTLLLQVANPPLLGVVAGVAVGLSPLGAVLFQPHSSAAQVRHPPAPIASSPTLK